jgi:hypothetical protein
MEFLMIDQRSFAPSLFFSKCTLFGSDKKTYVTALSLLRQQQYTKVCKIQDDSLVHVITSLTKFVVQPTIHVPHSFFLVCVFIDYSTL